MGPSDHLDKRALTRPILPEESQHFARMEIEINAIKGLNPGKTLAYAPHAQKGRFFDLGSQTYFRSGS